MPRTSRSVLHRLHGWELGCGLFTGILLLGLMTLLLWALNSCASCCPGRVAPAQEVVLADSSRLPVVQSPAVADGVAVHRGAAPTTIVVPDRGGSTVVVPGGGGSAVGSGGSGQDGGVGVGDETLEGGNAQEQSTPSDPPTPAPAEPDPAPAEPEPAPEDRGQEPSDPGEPTATGAESGTPASDDAAPGSGAGAPLPSGGELRPRPPEGEFDQPKSSESMDSRLVILVDKTKSVMTDPDRAWDRVRAEVERLLEEAGEGKKVGVFTFDESGAIPCQGDLVPATPAHISEILAALDAARVQDYTDPARAIGEVMESKPTNVVLISDGGFRSEASVRVIKANVKDCAPEVDAAYVPLGDAAFRSVQKELEGLGYDLPDSPADVMRDVGAAAGPCGTCWCVPEAAPSASGATSPIPETPGAAPKPPPLKIDRAPLPEPGAVSKDGIPLRPTDTDQSKRPQDSEPLPESDSLVQPPEAMQVLPGDSPAARPSTEVAEVEVIEMPASLAWGDRVVVIVDPSGPSSTGSGVTPTERNELIRVLGSIPITSQVWAVVSQGDGLDVPLCKAFHPCDASHRAGIVSRLDGLQLMKSSHTAATVLAAVQEVGLSSIILVSPGTFSMDPVFAEFDRTPGKALVPISVAHVRGPDAAATSAAAERMRAITSRTLGTYWTAAAEERAD